MDGRDWRLTYAEVGASSGTLPAGYQHLDRTRVVGHGAQAFDRAAEQVMHWGVQRGAGLSVVASAQRAAPGVQVTVRLGVGRLSVSAPCVVVATMEEPRRVGFAYGTTEGHPERGEELFLVQLHDDDTVTLTVRAFSRPGLWWSRALAPAVRVGQHIVTERYLRALCT